MLWALNILVHCDEVSNEMKSKNWVLGLADENKYCVMFNNGAHWGNAVVFITKMH